MIDFALPLRPFARSAGRCLPKLPTLILTAAITTLPWAARDLTCAAEQSTCAAEQSNSPNVVFILADDLGWGDLGCYGHPYMRTPNLDELAAEGTRFLQFYVNNPVCSPSRTAFLTSHYPVRHGVHGHFAGHRRNAQREMPDWLDPEVTTICDLLQEAGYVTGHFGKWHLTSGRIPDAPAVSKYGIDEYRTFNSKPNGWADVKSFASKSSELIVDEAIAFIKSHQDEPFYVNVWTHIPHAPLRPRPEELAVYADLKVDPNDFKGYMPEYLRQAEDLDSQMQVYCAEVTGLDHELGRLFAVLEETGLAEETIVVFSSDNGPEDYHIRNVRNAGVGSPGRLRGRKRSIYEGGVRVPLIVRWPGHVPAGRVDRTSVLTAVDFLPTVAALTGVEVPEKLRSDGENVADILLGKSRPRRKPIFWEWRFRVFGNPVYDPPRLAIRQGDWKLFMNAAGEKVELYNIPNDPGETSNVAGDHKEVVRRLRRRLRRWWQGLERPSAGSRDAR